jgi:hypothetical protein
MPTNEFKKLCCVSMRATPPGHWAPASVISGGTRPNRKELAHGRTMTSGPAGRPVVTTA